MLTEWRARAKDRSELCTLSRRELAESGIPAPVARNEAHRYFWQDWSEPWRELAARRHAATPPIRLEGQLPRARLLLAITFVLIGIAIRLPLASIAPVLHDIVRDTGSGQVGATVLTTLPVLCLGLFALVVPALTNRLGEKRTVILLLGLLASGAILRCEPVLPVLLISLVIAGAASGMLGALLPALIKRHFPDRIGPMMGLYVMAICVGIAVASAATVPLKDWLGGGWNYALGLWGAPALFAAAIFAPQVRHAAGFSPRRNAPVQQRLYRDWLAWFVTLFMALQLAIAYCGFGWLVPILVDRGLAPTQAGLVLAVSLLGQIAASFVVPKWAAARPEQRSAALVCVGITLAGFVGCLLLPPSLGYGMGLLMGFGQGGMMSVALVIVVQRSPSAIVATGLSAMAQGVGYSAASIGPLALGLLRSWAGNWGYSSFCIAMLALLAGMAGWVAGAPALVGVPAAADVGEPADGRSRRLAR